MSELSEDMMVVIIQDHFPDMKVALAEDSKAVAMELTYLSMAPIVSTHQRKVRRYYLS